MGEVEGRSYKDGYRAKVVQKSREEPAMKLIFEKLHKTYLFTFRTRAPLFFH